MFSTVRYTIAASRLCMVGVLAGSAWHCAASARPINAPAALIPYTYVYAPDSIAPNDPQESATPTFLNDGLIGVGWDATTMLYGNAVPTTNMPSVTLALPAHEGLEKLRVWYARAIEAGIDTPRVMTVRDNFGHSETTVFVEPPGNGTFSQDAALAGMQGTTLHLSITARREWVGLQEVELFAPEPEPPAAPGAPDPTDGNVSMPVTNSLGWNSSVGAEGYEIYFWSPPQTRPSQPSARVTQNHWLPTGIHAFETNYSWQVVATNAYGSATGAVWRFTTSPFPFSYVYEDLSARPENYGVQGYVETHYSGRTLRDGIVGGWGTLYYGQDYLGNDPADFWPAITLTLAKEPTYVALRIWHFGGGAAGVHAPASLTVTDVFNHSTTFSSFPDVGETYTDVPIAGMRGTTLRLQFGPNGIFVGISEIKVLAEPLARKGLQLLVR